MEVPLINPSHCQWAIGSCWIVSTQFYPLGSYFLCLPDTVFLGCLWDFMWNSFKSLSKSIYYLSSILVPCFVSEGKKTAFTQPDLGKTTMAAAIPLFFGGIYKWPVSSFSSSTGSVISWLFFLLSLEDRYRISPSPSFHYLTYVLLILRDNH